MQFILSIFAAILVQAFQVQAAPEYSTLKICTTKYGTKSVTPVTTSSYALTIPLTVTNKLTVTPTSTITPPPVTNTQTATTTTTSTAVTTPTATFTNTITQTSTTTTIAIVTTGTTTTTTTTTSVATSTVPTPAGFTPLASQPDYVPKKRSIGDISNPILAIRGRAPAQNLVCPKLGDPGAFKSYPQSVVCAALVIAKTTTVRTITASSTATTTLTASTSFVTSTITATATTTTAASPVSTTVTSTASTSTIETRTSTVTTTDTQTVTAVTASSTVYAACATNNIVNSANGNQGIFQVYYAGGGAAPATTEFGIDNAVSCCEQCQKTSGCTGYAKYPGASRCFVFTTGACTPSENQGQFFKTDAAFSPADGYTLGNGQCARIGNGGGSG